ncbi:MAG: hypothetical protein CSA84_00835 [Actinomycetales bacterium]|nr:MAG: hypothetical protein CSA84_00835 [Actinomycetales bacterium]
MAGFFGMNIEEVRSLSRQLQEKSQQINQIAQQLTSQLSGTDWKGPDAERFRSEWDSTHRAALQRVCDALQNASQNASRNADQQEQASGN